MIWAILSSTHPHLSVTLVYSVSVLTFSFLAMVCPHFWFCRWHLSLGLLSHARFSLTYEPVFLCGNHSPKPAIYAFFFFSFCFFCSLHSLCSLFTVHFLYTLHRHFRLVSPQCSHDIGQRDLAQETVVSWLPCECLVCGKTSLCS